MRVVFAALKGGCGKSTLALNLAVVLCRRGLPCHVQDLDPQRTLSDALQARAEGGHHPLPPTLSPSERAAPGITVIDVSVRSERQLALALDGADLIVAPVCPGAPDLWSLRRFVDEVARLTTRKRRVPITAFINRAGTHPNASAETAESEMALARMAGVDWLGVRIGQRTSIQRAFAAGLAASEVSPHSRAAAEIDDLARCICGRAQISLPPFPAGGDQGADG